MRVLFRRCLALLSFALLSNSVLAIEITETQTMGLSGTRTFTALTNVGETVNWVVDRITKYESNGSHPLIKTDVYKATGTTATFNLIKVLGKQTIWRIRATDSTGTDTHELQVFTANRTTSFTYTTLSGALLRTYVVAPAGLTKNSKMLVVMHPSDRSARDACSNWQDWTVAKNVLMICPLINRDFFPNDPGYQHGNVFADEENTILNPESKWSFTAVEEVQKYARKGFNLNDIYFDMWGHSAGAQFTHRFLYFKPDAKVRLAMSASAGFYMLPKLNTAYLCGPKHPQLSFTQEDMLRFTRRNAVLFIGTKDINPKDPSTGGCMDAQGLGRLARAAYFYAAVQSADPETTWRKVEFLGLDHDGKHMAKATQVWLDEQAQQGRALDQ